jgi:hypothetical protein
VESLLQGEKVGKKNNCYLSDVDQDILEMYYALDGVKQEAYSNALLLAMTFLQLVPIETKSSEPPV